MPNSEGRGAAGGPGRTAGETGPCCDPEAAAVRDRGGASGSGGGGGARLIAGDDTEDLTSEHHSDRVNLGDKTSQW